MRSGLQLGVKRAAHPAAFLAVLALLIQALLPAAAMAAQPSGRTIAICTTQGMQTVAVDDHGQPMKGGFAGLPCADCLSATTAAVLAPAVTIEPVSYVVHVAAALAQPAVAAPRARAPPRPFGQAPPTL